MGQVFIRNFDDGVLSELKRMAASDGKPLELFLRELLEAKVREERKGFFEFARGMRERCKPSSIDPTDLIREDRDR